MEKFSKNFKGGDNFLLITGGEISFSTTCPRQVLENFFWDFEKGGGEEQEKLLNMPKKSFGNLRPVSNFLLSVVGIVTVVSFGTDETH